MEHELLFMNPVFHPGMNVTVRNGDKWMKANVGDRLIIKETDKKDVLKHGRVVGKAHIPFKMVPEKWLDYEHDPSCHTYDGLLNEMKRVYSGFSEENYVVVLLFELTPD